MSDQNVIGYLFLCNNRTQNECIQKKLFGATRPYLGWVQEIKKGTPLFLYNVDSKTLFGVFRAASQGGWNINPRAWENVRPLEFPAQISVEYETIHKISMANRKLKLLKKTSTCKLGEEQTKELINALEKSSET